MSKKKKTADALTILHRRYYAGKLERLAALEEVRANDSVARKAEHQSYLLEKWEEING